MAVNSSEIGQFKELVDNLLTEVQSIAAESYVKDDVFQVEVSIFPLTTIKQSTRNPHA
jgi:hypothetical protein